MIHERLRSADCGRAGGPAHGTSAPAGSDAGRIHAAAVLPTEKLDGGAHRRQIGIERRFLRIARRAAELRHDDRRQDRNDDDYDEQFDQREAGLYRSDYQ